VKPVETALFTCIGVALLAGLAAAVVLAHLIRRRLVDRREVAPATPARGRVGRQLVDVTADRTFARDNTIQFARPITTTSPRHAAPENGEDRTRLLAKLDAAGYPAEHLAREAR
jgi:hypothetical protein